MQLNVFDKVMRVHRWFKIPAMSPRERAIYKKILLSLYAATRQPLQIFEYGSGFSTVYCAQFLKTKGIPFHIDSIDNHTGWHEAVRQMVVEAGLEQEVTLHVSPFMPFWEKKGWDWKLPAQGGDFIPRLPQEQAYIQKPLALGKKFDFIVVDGRFRRRCLELLPQCLKDQGIVFLHDAQKANYHAPLGAYPHGQFIDGGKYYPLEQRQHTIWVGGLNPINKGML